MKKLLISIVIFATVTIAAWYFGNWLLHWENCELYEKFQGLAIGYAFFMLVFIVFIAIYTTIEHITETDENN